MGNISSGKGAANYPIVRVPSIPTIKTTNNQNRIVSWLEHTANVVPHLINGALIHPFNALAQTPGVIVKATVGAVKYAFTNPAAEAKAKTVKDKGNNSSGGTDGGGIIKPDTNGYNKEYNLPPHKTSLPTSPQKVGGPNVAGIDADQTWSSGDPGHTVRRGRMWTYVGIPYIEGQTTYGSDKYNFGFQFLWNPTDININVHRNQEMVPASADFMTHLGGSFQGQESIQFTLYLDRTNDFAALKAFGVPGTMALGRDHYPYQFGTLKTPLEEKLMDLLLRGTNHDVEYFFKMINGDGGSYQGVKGDKVQKLTATKWKNGLGRETADTGYLSPTNIAVQFGPNPDSMSFVGYVETVNIKHTAFTQDMIPIRTQLDINMLAFSVTATN